MQAIDLLVDDEGKEEGGDFLAPADFFQGWVELDLVGGADAERHPAT